jgi:AcrR family transcriptional regulator
VSDASSKSRELLASVEHRGRFHHGDLRRALIDATFDLIDRHGVRGFTLAHASRAAGVSRSAPYKHFASREDLLAAVSLEAFDRFHAVICATPEAHKVKDDQHPREAVRSFLRTYARFAFERPAEARAMFGSGVDKSQHEALLKKDTESFDFLIDLVGKAESASGRPGREHAFEVAKHLFLAVHGLVIFALDGHDRMLGGLEGIHRSIDTLVKMWLPD